MSHRVLTLPMLLLTLLALPAQAQQSIARVLFENLTLTDNTPVANHTGFSGDGLDQADGFHYAVNSGGTLKYVTAEVGGGALFPATAARRAPIDWSSPATASASHHWI